MGAEGVGWGIGGAPPANDLLSLSALLQMATPPLLPRLWPPLFH